MTTASAQKAAPRFPVVATLVVLVAVAIMLRLGFWQLDRLHEKQALLARYAADGSNPAVVAFPADQSAAQAGLYRRSQLECRSVTGWQALSGRNAQGENGLAHEALCRLPDGQMAYAVIGWSRNPAQPVWTGGALTGWIGPRGKAGTRLVADMPQAGLAANARPNPGDVPNNHFSYAMQWFLFAATAMVIYGIAVWRRMSPAAP